MMRGLLKNLGLFLHESAFNRSVPVQFVLSAGKTLFKLRLAPGSYRFGVGPDADYVLPAHAVGEQFTVNVHTNRRVSISDLGDALRIRNPRLKVDARRRRQKLWLESGSIKIGRSRRMFPVAACMIALVMMTGLNTNSKIVAAAITHDDTVIPSSKSTTAGKASALAESEIGSRNLTRKLQGVGLPYSAKLDGNGDVVVSGEASENSRLIAEGILKSSLPPSAKIVFLQAAAKPLPAERPARHIPVDEPSFSNVKFVQVKPKSLIVFEDDNQLLVGSIDANGWTVEKISINEVIFSKSGQTVSRKF